jgi:hypothetical protein
VGHDAVQVAFHHPDPALRNGIVLESPVRGFSGAPGASGGGNGEAGGGAGGDGGGSFGSSPGSQGGGTAVDWSAGLRMIDLPAAGGEDSSDRSEEGAVATVAAGASVSGGGGLAPLDVSGMELLWKQGLGRLGLALEEGAPPLPAVVLGHKPLVSDEQRERLTETMFDVFNVRALYLVNEATLALTALERRTGLVIDIGHTNTRIVPVYDTYMLKHAVRVMDGGGELLTHYLAHLLSSRDCEDKAADGEVPSRPLSPLL